MEDKKRKTEENIEKISNNDIIKELENCELKNCEKWIWPYITLECKCLKVVDGDTITIGFIEKNKKLKVNVRFSGINVAEIHSKDSIELEKGKKVKLWLQDKILNKIIKVQFEPKLDKWGRPLGTIFLNEENINKNMLTLELAKEYNGTGEKKW